MKSAAVGKLIKQHILFIVGPPGVGKTTLVRAFMNKMDPEKRRVIVPKPKWTVAEGIFCAAGHSVGGTFDGADTVGYNQVGATLWWWFSNYALMPVTIFDGDRFSTEPTWEFFKAHLGIRASVGVQIRIVHMSADDVVLDARRKQRNSNQNATWMKGRVTKAANFASKDSNAIRLDANKPTDALLAEMLAALRMSP